MESLLFADLNEAVWVYCFVPCATLGVEKRQDFLQNHGVGRVTEERPFPVDVH